MFIIYIYNIRKYIFILVITRTLYVNILHMKPYNNGKRKRIRKNKENTVKVIIKNLNNLNKNKRTPRWKFLQNPVTASG